MKWECFYSLSHSHRLSLSIYIFSNLVCFSQWNWMHWQNLWTTQAKENKFINSWIHSGSGFVVYIYRYFGLNTHNLINDICRFVCHNLAYGFWKYICICIMYVVAPESNNQNTVSLMKMWAICFLASLKSFAFGYRTYLKWSHGKHFHISSTCFHWMYTRIDDEKDAIFIRAIRIIWPP